MPKTLTLRLTDGQSEELDLVQALTHNLAASKAIAQCVREYPKLRDELLRLQSELNDLTIQRDQARHALRDVRNAVRVLIDAGNAPDDDDRRPLWAQDHPELDNWIDQP